jgi:hypothetical protein
MSLVVALTPRLATFDADASVRPCSFQLAREVLEIAASHIKPGVTTDEIDKVVFAEAIKRDCYPSPLGYHGYPKSVCTYVALPITS